MNPSGPSFENQRITVSPSFAKSQVITAGKVITAGNLRKEKRLRDLVL
jgi:hypothetical protein